MHDNESLTVRFIGTSSGKTSLARFHSSLLINKENYNVLIDCGDGISRALLHQRINYERINAIILTHFHADHYSGLPSLLTNMKLTGRTAPLVIYVYKKLAPFLSELLTHSYLSSICERFELKIIGFDFGIPEILFDGLEFLAHQNTHVINKNKTPGKDIFYSSSLLFKDFNKTILFTSDIGKSEDLYIFGNSRIDLMISESTHIPVEEVIKAAEEMKVTQLIFTHLDDEKEFEIQRFMKDRQFNFKWQIAFDGYETKL